MTSIPSNSPRIPKNGYQYTNNEIKNMTPNSILTSNLSGKNPGHFNETEAFNEGYYYAITSNNASCYTFGNYTLTFFVLLKENEDASDNVDEKYVYSIYDNSTGRAVQIDDTDPNFDAKVREKFGMSYIELICKRGVLSYSVEQNTVLFNPAAASKARESDGSGGVPGGEGSSQVGSPDGVPGGTLVMKPLDSNSTHEVQLKDWAISNYINGYNGNHQIFEGMGFWDKTGAVITDAFGDDITIKGLFNEHSNSHQKAKPLQDFQIQLRNNQVLYVQDEYFEERYQEIMGVPYDAQAAENLYNLSTDYKMASYYKKLLGELENLLEEYRNKLGLNHADQWGSIQDEYIEKLKNLIGAGGDAESKKLLEAIEWGINQGYYVEPATGNDIVVCSIRQQYNLVQKHYNYALNGRSYEQLEREYKTTYKKLYGEEDKSEILIDQVGSAQMAGQVIKLTAVVILTELITQSPYLTEFMAQFLGGIPLAGRALEAMNNLIARFNGSIVREALKRVAGAQVFALTDAALTQVDGDWNKTADVFKNDEIYGLIGGLVISPIANKVGKIAGYSEDVFGGAKSVTVGANVTSRTITGEQLLNSTKNFINSLPEKALSTGVEITGFATVMQMVDDVDSNTAMDESAKMQAEMQIINNFVAFIMGGRGRGIYSRKTIEKATNDLGVKDWKISEEKTKTKEGTKTEIVVRDKKGKVLFRAENIDAVRLEISARIEAQAAAITKKPEMGLNGDESTRMNDAYNPDHTLDEVVVMLDNSGPEPAFVTNKQEGVSKEQMRAKLEEMGLPKDEIGKIEDRQLEDPQFQEAILGYEAMAKVCPDALPEFSEYLEYCKAGDMTGMEYVTNDNVANIDKCVDLQGSGKLLLECLKNDASAEAIARAFDGKNKLTADDVKLLLDIAPDYDCALLITPERFKAIKEIQEKTGIEFDYIDEGNVGMLDEYINNPEIRNSKYMQEIIARSGGTNPTVEGFWTPDLVNRYGQYREQGFNDFQSLVLSGVENIPKGQERAIVEAANAMKKIMGDSCDAGLAISRFMNEHPDIKPAELKTYVESLNMKDIAKVAPEVENYNLTQKSDFIWYHYKNGTTKFTRETLSYPKDLTEFVSDNYITQSDMEVLLSIFPCTPREVGKLPEGWSNEPGAQEGVVKAIDNFRETYNRNYSENNQAKIQTGDEAVRTLENELSAALGGKRVRVEFIGSGQLKSAYKVTVEGTEPVVLDIFHPKDGRNLHGEVAEPLTGMYMNKNSNQYVDCYMARIGNGSHDGFMLIQHADSPKLFKSENPVKTGNADYRPEVENGNGRSENFRNGHYIDYGGGYKLGESPKIKDLLEPKPAEVNPTEVNPTVRPKVSDADDVTITVADEGAPISNDVVVTVVKEKPVEKTKTADLIEEYENMSPSPDRARAIEQELIRRGCEISNGDVIETVESMRNDLIAEDPANSELYNNILHDNSLTNTQKERIFKDLQCMNNRVARDLYLEIIQDKTISIDLRNKLLNDLRNRVNTELRNSPNKRLYNDYLEHTPEGVDPVGDKVVVDRSKSISYRDLDRATDFTEVSEVADLIDFCERYGEAATVKDMDPQVREYLLEYADRKYAEYIESSNLPREVKDVCRNISDSYGTKIFLPETVKPREAVEALEMVDAELREWQRCLGDDCQYPPAIDFYRANSEYVNTSAAYGMGVAAGYSRCSTKLIALDGLTPGNVQYALRHEMTHSNDKKHLRFVEDGVIAKKSDGSIDFDNCQYREEFLRAGVDPGHVGYAYNNPAEFIAVASEGDVSMYSEGFKELLIEYGMDERLFNMRNENPVIQARIRYNERLLKQYPDGTTLEDIYFKGLKKPDMGL